jgi:cytochrome P450
MSGVPIDRLFDAEVIEDPYDYYAALREIDPVHRVEGTNAFVVSRGQLIQQVVSDLSTYSSQSDAFLSLGPGGRPGLRPASGRQRPADEGIPGVLATADPPDRARQRKVLSRLFSASALARRERGFRALLDAGWPGHRGSVSKRAKRASATTEASSSGVISNFPSFSTSQAGDTRRVASNSIPAVQHRNALMAKNYPLDSN